jgi:hypothetical protein
MDCFKAAIELSAHIDGCDAFRGWSVGYAQQAEANSRKLEILTILNVILDFKRGESNLCII